MKKVMFFAVALMCSQMMTACKKVVPGSDPNFTIVKNSDSKFKKANRKVVVFDIPIYAYRNVDDKKLLHAANVMAQYLDNDEDGVIDNPYVHQTLISNSASLFLWKNKTQINLPAQDLGDKETNPTYVSSGKTGRFDAALEEVFHVITSLGYSKAYPEVFGESAGTQISNAMDLARGGQFNSIPGSYPANAWYTYTDNTCNYQCQVAEYFYWAMTSILGAQSNRLDEIQQEWKLNTREKVEQQDPAVYALLTNPEYKFPTVLPDGTYRH